ncbi:MAG TPA: hypothetical protein VFQ35_18660 [Polyangiaceae bacterium]|nr:hypothetical protein [Polyangiaceae bacterium]
MRGLQLIFGFLFVCACSSSNDDKSRTREEFCADWAKAACTTQTVSACQATSAEACHLKQQAFCLGLVPADFSDARGDACINAVGAAYKDADLTQAELSTVLELGEPCNAIVRGPKDVGEQCSTDRDCDGTKGVRCVFHGAATTGTCQVAQEVGAGQRCSALAQTCGEGFYCDGNNCIAVKETGDDCTTSYECGSLGLCNDSVCAPKLAVGATCEDANQCASGICYSVNGQKTCADRIRLSPAESICENLR